MVNFLSDKKLSIVLGQLLYVLGWWNKPFLTRYDVLDTIGQNLLFLLRQVEPSQVKQEPLPGSPGSPD